MSNRHPKNKKANGYMLSNDHSNSNLRPTYNARPYNSERSYQGTPLRPRVDEDTLKTETIQIERKTFKFILKENPRGRFLRITEDVNGRRDSIIIPATGLDDVSKILDAMVQSAKQPPSSSV